MIQEEWTSLDLSFSARSLGLRGRALEAPVPYVTLQHEAALLHTSADSEQAAGKSWDKDEMINYDAKPTGLLSSRTAN